MLHLTLTDNTKKSFSELQDSTNQEQSFISAYEDINSVAGVSLNDLACKNSNLLIFPHCFGQNDDGIEEQHIIDYEGSPKYEENKIISVDNVKIKTGNLMGFIGFAGKGFHNTKVEIRSRFTENSSQDFFLHYMLEKVFNINLFNLNYSHGKNDGFDFIYLIFPVLLNRSVRQGIFRQYQTYEKNDANVKGPINVSRHIRQNVPFGGKVAYKSREYSFDNPLTQLIRHTIEYIKTKDFGRVLLSNNKETKNAVSQIVEVTNQTFQPQQRQNIISKNIRPINHPYYSEYANLQKLCLMILNHHKIQFSATQSPIYGILFDGAWLWEEYLATILRDSDLEKNFIHAENKTGKGGISLYRSDGGVRYPDFYRKKQKIKGQLFLMQNIKP